MTSNNDVHIIYGLLKNLRPTNLRVIFRSQHISLKVKIGGRSEMAKVSSSRFDKIYL